MLLEDAILVILSLSLLPLALSIFFYVTRPVEHTRFARRLSNAWLNPIGAQLVAQKVTLFAVISFILLVRFVGDFEGRQVVAYTLYFLLVIEFWWFLILQRRVQVPFERQTRQGWPKTNTPPTKGDNT